MRLFLCEKPSQAKDIGLVLGVLSGKFDGYYQKDDVAVTWCFGHMLANAMPDSYGDEYAQFGNIAALPLLPQEWKMVVPTKVSKQFKVIKNLLSKADEVVIATDSDREGEVIARELLDYCGYRKKITRFWTSGLDPASVKKALANIMPGKDKFSLYQAGLARSRADWLVGMNLSRAYTVAYADGFGKEHTLSIGRIQTPTLNLVVRRDFAIENFQPYPYYTLTATFASQNVPFDAIWQIPDNLKNADGLCVHKNVVESLKNQLLGQAASVQAAKTERKRTPPPLPYSLSALQKEAGKRLGLSPAKVLDIAQNLYEKYKITSYPRTPCRYLPKSQQGDVPNIFDALLSLDASLAPILKAANPHKDTRLWNDSQVNKYSHHAIVPTTYTQTDLSSLNKQEYEIYLMIRNRYIAQFYPDFEYDSSVIELLCCEQLFRAVGQVPKIQGWKTLLGGVSEESEETQDDAQNTLPVVQVNDVLPVQSCQMDSKKTAPPPRFTESSLLDEMQTLSDFLKTVDDEQIKKVLRATEGLGTEATRANIISRLFEMGYIEKQKGKVLSTDKGRKLIAAIPSIVSDPITTAKWEIALSGIESGKISLDEFMLYQSELITRLVQEAKTAAANRPALTGTYEKSAMRKPKATGNTAGQSCPSCKTGSLIERQLKKDPQKRYLGCTRYPECNHFEWL